MCSLLPVQHSPPFYALGWNFTALAIAQASPLKEKPPQPGCITNKISSSRWFKTSQREEIYAITQLTHKPLKANDGKLLIWFSLRIRVRRFDKNLNDSFSTVVNLLSDRSKYWRDDTVLPKASNTVESLFERKFNLCKMNKAWLVSYTPVTIKNSGI